MTGLAGWLAFARIRNQLAAVPPSTSDQLAGHPSLLLDTNHGGRAWITIQGNLLFMVAADEAAFGETLAEELDGRALWRSDPPYGGPQPTYHRLLRDALDAEDDHGQAFLRVVDRDGVPTGPILQYLSSRRYGPTGPGGRCAMPESVGTPRYGSRLMRPGCLAIPGCRGGCINFFHAAAPDQPTTADRPCRAPSGACQRGSGAVEKMTPGYCSRDARPRPPRPAARTALSRV